MSLNRSPGSPTTTPPPIATTLPTATATTLATPTAPATTETATATATATPTATDAAGQDVDITGMVLVRPQYSVAANISPPIEYVVVLDTSGSMNWNFDGEAKTSSGTIIQCGWSTDSAREAKRAQDIAACTSEPKWSPVSERRISVAKNAINSLIDLLQPYDAMQIIGFSADTNTGAGIDIATASWQYGDAAGKTILKQAALDAGMTNSDPYATSGGTPSATGLHEAYKLMAAAPGESIDGRSFKKAIIFLTDGIANYFLESYNPGTGFGWVNDGHDNPSCAGRRSISLEPDCQIGKTNTNPQIERPITAMITQGRALQQLSTVYVVGLGDLNGVGLDQVASAPESYFNARQPADLPAILAAIPQAFVTSSCEAAGGSAWADAIDATHSITDTTLRGTLGLPADSSVFGYAYLYTSSGELLQAAQIRHDQASGKLAYTFSHVAPGAYEQSAYVGYLGDDRPVRIGRIYDSIMLLDSSHAARRTITIAPAQQDGERILEPLSLDLQGSVCREP